MSVALALPQPANTKEDPVRLAASSKWRLDYAEDSCKLMRYYGTGKDQVAFVLERFGATDAFWLWLAGEPMDMPKERKLALRFAPAGNEQRTGFYRAKADGSPSIVFTKSLSLAPASEEQKEPEMANTDVQLIETIDEEREKAVTELSIVRSGRDLVLELGSMGEPFKAMRVCTDHLLSTWGFDTAKRQSLHRLPQPQTSPGKWLLPSDYPTMQLMFGERAIVHFRLYVDDKGNPAKCYIQGIIGEEDFKKAVCAALKKRARFDPALDKGGNPIP